MSRLCIVPCGNAKIWDKEPKAGPTEAQYVYTGVFAVACQRYAKAFFDNWVILSAKYGFLFPEDIIKESYNVSFIKPSKDTISIEELKEQAERKGLYDYQEITVLGGKHYVDRVTSIFGRGQIIKLPLSDCKGIGYMLQKLAQAVEANMEIEAEGQSQYRMVSSKSEKSKWIIRKTGKYTALHEFLTQQEDKEIEMTLQQIESILGFPLPSSATKHRAWWANDIHHSHAKSWLLANWEVEKVSLPVIKFKKGNE
jgi:hypothetical protein